MSCSSNIAATFGSFCIAVTTLEARDSRRVASGDLIGALAI
jgi:hypothetical protein